MLKINKTLATQPKLYIKTNLELQTLFQKKYNHGKFYSDDYTL
jgi:hypothetical protein